MRLKAPYFHAWFSCAAKKIPPRFAIVTAHNPMGGKSSPAANRRRDAALRARLKGLGFRRFRVTGGNEDGTHQEPGWGFVADKKTARALAAEFEQDAYYMISSGRIYLGSAAGGCLMRAGSWNIRRARW